MERILDTTFACVGGWKRHQAASVTHSILILEAPKSKTTSGNMFTGIDILFEN